MPTCIDTYKKSNYFYSTLKLATKIPLRNGGYLSANIYRPDADGQFPVLLTIGPYGKDTHYLEQNAMAKDLYAKVQDKGPYVSCGTPNPEFWVPQGYIVIRADQRGTGESPGKLELCAETLKTDYLDAIEWAGTSDWSSGKVGLLGFSYYASMQWLAAAEQPQHLTCMVAWEGSPDFYSDAAYAGGIMSDVFFSYWWKNNILPHQYGKEYLSENQLAKNHVDLLEDFNNNPIKDLWWNRCIADLEHVKIPFLSAGNWFSAGMFSRGNIKGFLNARSDNKWLEMHTGSHFVQFYSEESRAMQKKFLDYWLKGIDTGLMKEPKIKLAIPEGNDKYTWYYDNEYPIKNTHWFYYYLDAATNRLISEPPLQMSSLHYKGDRDKESVHWAVPMQKKFDISESDPYRVMFRTAPLTEKMRLAGPIKLRLFASSSSDDMDIFVTLRNINANGKEVVNSGCYTSNYPISQGWLRASLRKTDNVLSTEYKPSYLYNEVQKLEPDQIYPLDIEIWDSAMTIEAGNSLVLEIGSQDQSGCSLLMHTGKDRIWDADVTVYTGGYLLTYLMLPLIWE